MLLSVALSLFWFFVAALGGPPQYSRNNWEPANIPNITRDGRRCDVDLEKFLYANQVFTSCKFPLPVDTRKFYSISPATLCFGMYDTLYELCRYQNLSVKLPAYNAEHFCEKASKALVNYNFKHSQPLIREWTKHLKTGLTNKANCTDLCVHGDEINPECAIIVAVLEQLPDAIAAASKPTQVTSFVEVSESRSSTAPALQKNSSVPYKASDPSLAKGKTPAPVVPVAPVNTNENPKVGEEGSVKLGTTDNSPPVNVKPESPANPENKASEPEPKVENAELEQMEQMGAEDDDINAMEAQAQPDMPGAQPDIPGAQPDKLPKDTQEKIHEEDVKQDNPILLPEDSYLRIKTDDSEETNMVTYFVLMTGGAVLLYVAFHNKNKLLALALEGRRTGRRGGRHSSAAYSKLHSNLEETIASGPTSPSATHVLY